MIYVSRGGHKDGVFNKEHKEKGDQGRAARMSALQLAATVAWSLLSTEAEQMPQNYSPAGSSLAEDVARAFISDTSGLPQA